MLLSVLALVGLAAACGDYHSHARDTHAEKREYPQFPLTPPYRPLVWGDFNVIHTTDTHGWLLGHQKSSWPEPNYSGDLGDFASFVAHMKQIAVEKNVDLLLVDSGDVHDGTGLSDGYPPGGVDAHESNKFLERLPYDVMAIGNHELYVYADTYDIRYTNFVPQLNGRYLSLNVNITVFNSDGETVSVPVGNRFVKFTTAKGRRVTSLGALYDFTGNSVNTTVQFVADMVKESWVGAHQNWKCEIFLKVTHMPVSYDNWPVVFNAIRAVHPLTPILIFGGHTHIRDCQQYDGRSMALESGRYMETIGANLGAAQGNSNNISFTRRYLDQNRVTYQYHTQTSNSTFDTSYGRSITTGLEDLAEQFDLSYLYGYAPQDYTLSRNPYPSNGSVLSLFVDDGEFTKNDQLTALPFTDSFLYIPNITFSIANQVLPALNSAGASDKKKRATLEMEMWRRGYVDDRYNAWLKDMFWRAGPGSRTEMAGNLTLGYVTTDPCPGYGDDTLHTAVPYYSSPDYIGSAAPNLTDDTAIDLVFIVTVLNTLQNAKNYTDPVLANQILELYAQAKWN
ncbi:Metallo-dependent phosphatase-like protein [Pisolithus orientalis]|uniref:Metallo-dependent phosphatase-like protein n=1 Tax=Pisolithus orientalis TaxID=936130 RepID=UPI0022255787|nr:Metallo-dependent phosphatase-like protein [Pisolithus orientalis]KAI5995282.1 Metallo-dependent phosphatase-like protein [Pisolithus orientalis]